MDSLETRMTNLKDTLSDTQVTLSDVVDRLNGLETDYGEITQATKAMLREYQNGVNEDTCLLTQEIHNLRTFVEHKLRAIRVEMEEICIEWGLYRNSPTIHSGATMSTNTIQVPKPSTYSGNQKAIEVENFLFGLEQYFEAKGVRDNATRIANAPTFLQGFRQTMVAMQICRLRCLKQSGSISDYIKEFTALILEIEDMSDKDKLFYFMDDLKDWARVELERQNVQDLDAAIAVA
ncbi:hypothetical protein EZV62_026900 [Acer yangbiense]|uniref:Retrotransposon gag domain-containing protein n=1 Tax=Acer yangbiense TaxID=1000413 RepID=A0A5C7GU28_9ROSI|nr:hypothetical protein EZV62_026900 [Acer yangbiense]